MCRLSVYELHYTLCLSASVVISYHDERVRGVRDAPLTHSIYSSQSRSETKSRSDTVLLQPRLPSLLPTALRLAR